MGVDPHPHRRHQPPRIDTRIEREHHDRHQHETDQQRPGRPRGRPDRDHGAAHRDTHGERLCARRELPDEPNQQRGRQPERDAKRRATAARIDDAVERRREPTLHDPRRSPTRVRIRVGRAVPQRAELALHQETPGGDVRQQAVVAETRRAHEEAEEGEHGAARGGQRATPRQGEARRPYSRARAARYRAGIGKGSGRVGGDRGPCRRRVDGHEGGSVVTEGSAPRSSSRC